MAKHGSTKAIDHPDREWEVKDAMHTMLRAREIIADKKLLAAVKKKAAEHAKELTEVSRRADQLAKMGHISPKAMEKLKA